MATEKELEVLDSYLANRLNTKEKADFEQKLVADQSLRSEFEFQQRLIEGLKKARAAELKSMLNNVPLSAIETNETTWITKIITGCVMVGLLGTGLYFFLDKDEEEKPNTSAKKENKIASPNETIANTPPVDQKLTPVPEETQPLKTEKKTSLRTLKKNIDSSKTIESKVTEKRKIEIFDPTHEMEGEVEQNSSEIESGDNAAESSIAVETDNTNKKYTFNYQFKDGKLFLYGSFEKDPYEILEFFDENKRTMFLFYKDNYYLLDEESQKVKLLTPITDPVLLKKLREQ